MSRLQLAPSILTADFGRLDDEARSVSPFVDWFHLDVMDGHYVPNITFGPSTVRAVAEATSVPVHVHLMIEDPEAYANAFAAAGAGRISFHPEVTSDPKRVIEAIRETGASPGIAIHPDVPLQRLAPLLDWVEVVIVMTVRPGFGGQAFIDEVVPKITEVRHAIDRAGLGVDVEVDGGVNMGTIERAVDAGAGILVVGSALFDGKDPAAAARSFRDKLDQLAQDPP